MILKSTKEDISDNDYNKTIGLHLKLTNKYVQTVLLPNLCAYYIAIGYYKSCMYNENYDIVINTIFDFFNLNLENTDMLKTNINEILKANYNLVIVRENPLDIKEI